MSLATLNARETDPGTSHEAAALLDESDIEIVSRFLREDIRDGGWTRTEIAAELGWTEYRTSKRLSDAARTGFVEKLFDADGDPVTRPGPSGRRQQAHQAVRAEAVSA